MKHTLLTGLFILSALHQIVASTTLVATKTAFDATVAAARAGDTILLSNGTWTDVVLGFYANGEQGKPIVLGAETAGAVILTGSSRVAIYGKYLEVHNLYFKDGALAGDAIVSFRRSSSQLAENCRLTNCRIINYNPATNDVEYKWVSIFGINNRVDHCTFSGKNNDGALLVVWLNGAANYHQIDHNYFSDIPRLNRNGAETIRIGTSDYSMTESRSIIEYNVFERCDGELEIISNKSNFNIYRYNTFRNNDGGLTLRHGNDCEVYGNFFFGAAGKSCAGVRIIGERHKVYNNHFQDLEGTSTRAAISLMNGVPNSPLNRYFQVKDAEVVHNTIVSCKQALAFGVGKSEELSLPPMDCTIGNNVVDKATGNDPIIYVDQPINVSYISNIVHYNNLTVMDEGIMNIDPALILQNGLWRADRSSAVVDASMATFTYVNADMDGQLRDDRPDIGSDEVSQENITNVPLNSDDVGANWESIRLSVNAPKMLDIKVFVANSALHISDLATKFAPYNLGIYNLKGEVIFDQKLSEPHVSIPTPLLRGVYIIKIVGSGQVYYVSKVWF